MVDQPTTHAGFGCLRWDTEGDRQLAALTPDGWCALMTALDVGAGLPLLARRLRRSSIRPPEPVAGRLRAHGLALAARTLQAQTQLAAAIAAAGRPALLLKGVDLADRLYGNLAHRAMGDVDFLVHNDDAPAYHAVLLAAGFEADGEPDAAMRAIPWQHHNLYTSTRPNQLPFELHWRLSGGAAGDVIDLPGIWNRSLPHVRLGADARVMGKEDLFLYLCLHLRHHLFEVPLTSLWDIAELIDCPSLPLDWAIIWDRAQAWHLEDAVQTTLFLVTQTLGAPTIHLSNWKPSPTLAQLLPDGPTTLGMFSPTLGFANRWLGQALATDISWQARGKALLRGLVPPRLMVRRQFGRPDQGALGDIVSYARRLRAIWRERARAALSWRKMAGAERSRLSRLVRLRRHLGAPLRDDIGDGGQAHVFDER